MTFFQAIILGIVEGITEFLPVSSTGHLILVGKLLKVPDGEFTKTFEIFIQLGAILAVVVLYWKRMYSEKETRKRVFVAFLPALFLGFFLYAIIRQFLFLNSVITLWMLFLGGVLLVIFDVWYKRKDRVTVAEIKDISYKNSFLIGLAQSLAMFPGVSRSAATIIGGLAVGIKRETIVEFSFLLAIPTIAAASGYDLLKNGLHFSLDEFYLLATGFIVSFLVAMVSVQWLLRFAKNHSFISFGIYRMIVAVVFLLFVVK